MITSATRFYIAKAGRRASTATTSSQFAAVCGKMEFLAEDMAAAEPSDEQLAAYLAANPDRFRTEDRLTFHQIFLGRHGAAARWTATRSRSRRRSCTQTARSTRRGSAMSFCSATLSEKCRAATSRARFGENFAVQLSDVVPGRWNGPIASNFGAHFVFVDERVKGDLPPLATVRDAMRRQWQIDRQTEAEQKLYRSLRDRYEIVVETLPTARGRGRAMRWLALCLTLGSLLSYSVRADEIRPGYLELRQMASDT